MVRARDCADNRGSFCLDDLMMTEETALSLPDRLSIDPRSPHHNPALMQRTIAIVFNGRERFDVEEYCISEGWIKVASGKTVDRHGRPLLIKLKGQVQASVR
jgi:hypothetical protein